MPDSSQGSWPPSPLSNSTGSIPLSSPLRWPNPSPSWPGISEHPRVWRWPQPERGSGEMPQTTDLLARALKGVQPLIHFRYTFPSCLPDPSRLVVPTRPVVVRAASRPSLRFQGQAALSFTALLRQVGGGVLSSPHGFMAPRGALPVSGNTAGEIIRHSHQRCDPLTFSSHRRCSTRTSCFWTLQGTSPGE